MLPYSTHSWRSGFQRPSFVLLGTLSHGVVLWDPQQQVSVRNAELIEKGFCSVVVIIRKRVVKVIGDRTKWRNNGTIFVDEAIPAMRCGIEPKTLLSWFQLLVLYVFYENMATVFVLSNGTLLARSVCNGICLTRKWEGRLVFSFGLHGAVVFVCLCVCGCLVMDEFSF